MAVFSMLAIARQVYADPAGFKAKHPHPFLVWAHGGPRAAPIVEPTHSIGGVGVDSVPSPSDPLVLEIVKGTQSAFAFGVTVGRTENNDVVLRHNQVSRFHAYVQKAGAGYALVDADSKNGTFVAGVRLAPNKPAPLPSRVKVGFGELEVEFFAPGALADYLLAPTP